MNKQIESQKNIRFHMKICNIQLKFKINEGFAPPLVHYEVK